MDQIADFNWDDPSHRITPVWCEFHPRSEYKGRPIKEGLAEKTGIRLYLIVLWKMDSDDPYPGEYALGYTDSTHMLKALNLTWVASGDVRVVDPT